MRYPVGFDDARLLGDAWPVDYVFAGAVVNYEANVKPSGFWEGAIASALYRANFTTKFERVKNYANAYYQVNRAAMNADAGSLVFTLRVAGDMASINDVKSTMDSQVRAAGFDLLASHAYFLSNPRRDATKQPTVGTPGADPRYTQKPVTAGGFESKPPVDTGVIQFWADTFFKGNVDLFGLQVPKYILAAAAGVAVVLVARR
jgi:hypothetical protein